MDYDELVFQLYQVARESQDVVFEDQMVDLGWSVKKNGIRGDGDDPEDDIHFKDLIHRLEAIADQAKDPMDKLKVDNMRNELIAEGVDGYLRKFWNY